MGAGCAGAWATADPALPEDCALGKICAERGRTLMRLVRREVCSVNEAELTHDGYQVEP